MTQELPEGTVTIVFTDVVGSTGLITALGDAAAQEVMRAQRGLVREQIKSSGGYEVKGTGDGFMVAFQSARRAVECAIGIQRAVQEHNDRQPADRRALIRIGMNSGEVIREDADMFGSAVNAAARVASKAGGNQILVSETVKALLGAAKDFRFTDRGRFRLKGFPERWRLFELSWQVERPLDVPIMVERIPLVGREAERRDLRQSLDNCVKGQGSLVLIVGEPGVGKTRLTEELIEDASRLGVAAYVGRCYEVGAPPYIPFVEIMQAAIRRVPAEALRVLLGDNAPEVANIVPEVRRLVPDLPRPLEMPVEQERHYLLNSVREFLVRAAAAQPLLLVIEDLQWADESTLLLLEHIAPHLSTTQSLVACTYRDVEVESSSGLGRTLDSLLRQRLARTVHVKALGRSEVGAMLRALASQEPPESFVEVIWSETEGNPFFVEEVFKHLAEDGRLIDSAGRWREDVAIGETDVPASLRLVIGRRLSRLNENTKRALTAAAVIGRTFNFELLRTVSDIGGDDLLDAVDEAERASLILSTAGDAEPEFSFGHELIRQTLLATVSGARRQSLHLRIAEAMQETQDSIAREQSSDLAYHLKEAGSTADPAMAARYLGLAGDQALSAAAYEDALRQFEDALVLLPHSDRREHAHLLYQRGMSLRGLGRWEEALKDSQEAFRLYEAEGDRESAGKVCAELTQQLIWSGRFLEALEISQRGLTILGKTAGADRCTLLTGTAVVFTLAGLHDGSRSIFQAAVAMAESLGDRRTLGRVLAWQAFHHFCYARGREIVETGTRAIEILRAEGDLWELANALWITQIGLLALGRHDEMERMIDEIEQLAGRLGHLGALVFATRSRAIYGLLMKGDIDGLEKYAQEELQLCQGANLPMVSGSYSFLAVVRFWRGHWEDAIEQANEACEHETGGMFIGLERGRLLVIQSYAGGAAAADRVLREKCTAAPPGMTIGRGVKLFFRLLRASRYSYVSLSSLRDVLFLMRTRRLRHYEARSGRPNSLGTWMLLEGEVEGYFAVGADRAAAALYPRVVEALAVTGSLMTMSANHLVETIAGIAASAGRQWVTAEAHYAKALRQAEDLPHLVEQPEIRRFYARMLIDRDGVGDRTKAAELLGEAITMYQRIGMPKHIELATSLLNELRAAPDLTATKKM